MITEEQIPTILKSKGINIPEEDYLNLLLLIKSEIQQYISIPIEPESYTQIDKEFEGDSLIVNNYPIREIHRLTINDKVITEKDYILDDSNGIIHFKTNHQGLLHLEYIAGLTDEQSSKYIVPLIINMFEYDFDNGWTKNASSIKEGDVTVSFDTSIGKGALIQRQLYNLKNMFSGYCRML